VIDDIYKSFFKLYDESDIDNPIRPVIKTKEKESAIPLRLEMVIVGFSEKRIYQNFGLNLLEFLDLPQIEVNYLFECADKINETKAAVMADVANDADRLEEELNQEGMI
jgi:hypothetical protein